jgi:hypothetical protein
MGYSPLLSDFSTLELLSFFAHGIHGRNGKGNSFAGHRDGSPYRLRIRRMPLAKQVGRTVSVSRRSVWFLNFRTLAFLRLGVASSEAG